MEVNVLLPPFQTVCRHPVAKSDLAHDIAGVATVQDTLVVVELLDEARVVVADGPDADGA